MGNWFKAAAFDPIWKEVYPPETPPRLLAHPSADNGGHVHGTKCLEKGTVYHVCQTYVGWDGEETPETPWRKDAGDQPYTVVPDLVTGTESLAILPKLPQPDHTLPLEERVVAARIWIRKGEDGKWYRPTFGSFEFLRIPGQGKPFRSEFYCGAGDLTEVGGIQATYDKSEQHEMPGHLNAGPNATQMAPPEEGPKVELVGGVPPGEYVACYSYVGSKYRGDEEEPPEGAETDLSPLSRPVAVSAGQALEVCIKQEAPLGAHLIKIYVANIWENPRLQAKEKVPQLQANKWDPQQLRDEVRPYLRLQKTVPLHSVNNRIYMLNPKDISPPVLDRPALSWVNGLQQAYWKALQADGGSVFVEPGTYTLKTCFNPRSRADNALEDAGPVRVYGITAHGHRGKTRFTYKGTLRGGDLLACGANSLELENLEFVDESAKCANGIAFYGGSADCELVDSGFSVTGAGSIGLQVGYEGSVSNAIAKKLTAYRCTFHGGGWGISLHGAHTKECRFRNCTTRCEGISADSGDIRTFTPELHLWGHSFSRSGQYVVAFSTEVERPGQQSTPHTFLRDCNTPEGPPGRAAVLLFGSSVMPNNPRILIEECSLDVTCPPKEREKKGNGLLAFLGAPSRLVFDNDPLARGHLNHVPELGACPSCKVHVDAEAEACPACGAEFPEWPVDRDPKSWDLPQYTEVTNGVPASNTEEQLPCTWLPEEP